MPLNHNVYVPTFPITASASTGMVSRCETTTCTMESLESPSVQSHLENRSSTGSLYKRYPEPIGGICTTKRLTLWPTMLSVVHSLCMHEDCGMKRTFHVVIRTPTNVLCSCRKVHCTILVWRGHTTWAVCSDNLLGTRKVLVLGRSHGVAVS